MSPSHRESSGSGAIARWLRDVRFWRVAGQAIAVVAVVSLGATLWSNLIFNLQQLRIQLGFEFLRYQASFGIGETLIPYTPSDSYIWALLVGLLNSLRVMALGIVLTTVVGGVAGIARLSDNWLIRKLALVYVEIFRNTPLLLQLFFWYFAVFLSAPVAEERWRFWGGISVSKQGLTLPWLEPVAGTPIWLGLGAIALLLAVGVGYGRSRLGPAGHPRRWGLGVAIAGGLLIWAIAQGPPFAVSLTTFDAATGRSGGLYLSAELSALLLGLVFYTGSFIAEIVRAGVQAVPRGQWEAAQALGLSPALTMRRVILPQALRVMIPPMTSQYLNLAKNTSLAIAIGYPDVYFVASATFNQTGRAVEVMALIMVTYLSISLVIALVMNGLNRWVQIKER